MPLYKGEDRNIDVREELWYRSYFQANEATINNLVRKNKNVDIKMIGIQGCLEFGLRTRFEWTALQEDINRIVASGKIPTKPTWAQIKFDSLLEELEWVQKNDDRVVLLCSCPSQIGKDTTIMQRVKDLLDGNARVELTFSEAGSGASELFQSMGISGGGGGAAEQAGSSKADKARRLFAMLDLDGNGKLSAKEVAEFAKRNNLDSRTLKPALGLATASEVSAEAFVAKYVAGELAMLDHVIEECWKIVIAIPMPGGYKIGDTVYSKVKHSDQHGTLSVGGRGEVVGPDTTGRGRTDRVNVQYEGYKNVLNTPLDWISKSKP